MASQEDDEASDFSHFSSIVEGAGHMHGLAKAFRETWVFFPFFPWNSAALLLEVRRQEKLQYTSLGRFQKPFGIRYQSHSFTSSNSSLRLTSGFADFTSFTISITQPGQPR